MSRFTSSRGITLIETMIALGVAAVLMLAILQIVQISAKSNRDVKFSFDKSNVVSNMRQLLNNGEACQTFVTESALQLNAAGGVGSTWSLPAGGVLRYNGSDVVPVSIAPALPPRQGVWATQVQVINQSGAGVDLGGGSWRHTVDLVISLQKFISNDAGAIQTVGGPTVETLTFTAIVGGTAGSQPLTGCFGELSEGAICALFGATHQTVDPTVPACLFTRLGVVQNAGEWGTEVAPKPAGVGHTFVGGDLFLKRSQSINFGQNFGGTKYQAQIQDTASELVIHGGTLTLTDADRKVRVLSGGGMRVEGTVSINPGGLNLNGGQSISLSDNTAYFGGTMITLAGPPPSLDIFGATPVAGIAGLAQMRITLWGGGGTTVIGPMTINNATGIDGNVPHGCHLVASAACGFFVGTASCPANERVVGGGVRCPTNVDFIRSSTRGAAEEWQGVCQRIGIGPGPALTSTPVCPASVHAICCKY